MAAGDGLVSMKPTSIAHSGTSASINADGGVDFTAVTELSLNGVFTSDYDNYLVVMEFTGSTSALVNINGKLRLSGTDATATNYTVQQLSAYGTTIGRARTSSLGFFAITWANNEQRYGGHLHVYGPALAQPTAFRSVNVAGYQNASFYDVANTHSLSTAYDGLTIEPDSGNFTGQVHVFGYEE